MTGRLLALDVARSKIGISVIGPISDEIRTDRVYRPRL
jgi:hypothetical protein